MSTLSKVRIENNGNIKACGCTCSGFVNTFADLPTDVASGAVYSVLDQDGEYYQFDGETWGDYGGEFDLAGGGVEIVDSLTDASADKALSAKQGKLLNDNKSNLIYVKQFSFPYTLSANANGNVGGVSGELLVSGYNLLGIIGYFTNDVRIHPINLSVNGGANSLQCYLSNISAQAVTNTFIARCIYVKN